MWEGGDEIVSCVSVRAHVHLRCDDGGRLGVLETRSDYVIHICTWKNRHEAGYFLTYGTIKV